MGRLPKRRNRRARSRPDKEVRTTDVPLDVCTDVVRRVLAAEIGAVEEPTTGFFRWTQGSPWNRVVYTLRTYGASPGTRIALEARADLASSPYLLMLLSIVLVTTAGLGVLFLVPFLATARSERKREVDMFKWLRAIELALTPSQGSYRIAAGALTSAPTPSPVSRKVRLVQPDEGLDGDWREDEERLEAEAPPTGRRLKSR